MSACTSKHDPATFEFEYLLFKSRSKLVNNLNFEIWIDKRISFDSRFLSTKVAQFLKCVFEQRILLKFDKFAYQQQIMVSLNANCSHSQVCLPTNQQNATKVCQFWEDSHTFGSRRYLRNTLHLTLSIMNILGWCTRHSMLRFMLKLAGWCHIWT